MSSASGMPTPGGLGGGIIYIPGQLVATDGSKLVTTMFVHPEGLNASAYGLEWLFTTSTNRTEQGVEVVGIYHRQDANEYLGVFDWSCSAQYPCPDADGQTDYEAHWVWTSNLTNFACNTKTVKDPSGRNVQVIQYRNHTEKTSDKKVNPPVWVNTVLLHNYCNHRWDRVWQHQYVADQTDCSTGYDCGWWGPILETFPSGNGQPFPDIAELGFEHTTLEHNKTKSQLPPSEASFSGVAVPWQLFWLDPDQGYGAGNS